MVGQAIGDQRRRNISAARQQLIEVFQRLNFGRIENLSVRNGDPVSPAARQIVREIKFGGDNESRPEMSLHDFCLKSQLVKLFECFDRWPNCQIEVLVVKHGLPFHMCLRESCP